MTATAGLLMNERGALAQCGSRWEGRLLALSVWKTLHSVVCVFCCFRAKKCLGMVLDFEYQANHKKMDMFASVSSEKHL